MESIFEQLGVRKMPIVHINVWEGFGEKRNLTLVRISTNGFQVIGAGGPNGTLKFNPFSKFNAQQLSRSNSNTTKLVGAWIPREEDP